MKAGIITYSIFFVFIVIIEYIIFGRNKKNSIPTTKPEIETFVISPSFDNVLNIGIIIMKIPKTITIELIKKANNLFCIHV